MERSYRVISDPVRCRGRACQRGPEVVSQEPRGDGGEDRAGGEGLVLVNGPPDSVQGPRARALFGGSARVVYKERGRVGSARPVWSAVRGRRGGRGSWD